MSSIKQPPIRKIPVTIVTGFLGSGKTTLINNLLTERQNLKIAVIVNEFGELGIDGDLIKTGDEELIELNSGCICCVVRGDLIRTLRDLLNRPRTWDGIVIETTGLANPSPVIQTFLVDQVIAAQCELDSVVCLVDAAHVSAQIEQFTDAADQIAFADHILLNKIDVAAEPVAQIEGQLRELNPFAQITHTQRSKIPSSDIFGQDRFSLHLIEHQLGDLTDDHDVTGQHNHIHTSQISSLSLTSNAVFDQTLLEEWLQDLLLRHGNDILRSKGILALAGSRNKFVFQSVNMMTEGAFADPWHQNNPVSKIVFIGRNLNEDMLRRGFESCQSPQAA